MAAQQIRDVFATNLDPHIADLMRRTVERREGQGLNVHFINADGERDRFSFRDPHRVELFRKHLKRHGLREVKP